MPIPLGILAVAGAGAGAANSFDLLETTVLGTAAQSVTFSNLNTYSDYKHLQLRLVAMAATGVGNGNIQIRPNGATTNQNYHFLRGRGGNVSSGYTGSEIYLEYIQTSPNAAVIDFLDYANTNKFKTIRSLHGQVDSVNSPVIYLTSGLWRETTAMTSLVIRYDAGNFAVGSRFSLYGIK